MAEGVDLPTYFIDESKLVVQKLMTICELVDYILVISSSLIIHHPPSASKGKLSVLNQGFDFTLGFSVLLVIPSFEIVGFYLNKFALLVC